MKKFKVGDKVIVSGVSLDNTSRIIKSINLYGYAELEDSYGGTWHTDSLELVEEAPVVNVQYVYNQQKVPYACPVCQGRGLVPNAFYSSLGGNYTTSSTTPEICRSCSGTGIIFN